MKDGSFILGTSSATGGGCGGGDAGGDGGGDGGRRRRRRRQQRSLYMRLASAGMKQALVCRLHVISICLGHDSAVTVKQPIRK